MAEAPTSPPRRRWPTILLDNWFILGLLFAVGLACVVPEPGQSGGALHTEHTTRLGVAFIFLLQGLTLPLAALGKGARNLRLHAVIQGFTFVVVPLLGIGLDLLLGRYLPDDLRRGLLYLCVLPSTIKTAVVFSSLAGGDAAAAIFSATLSSILGVFITPLWVAWLAPGGSASASHSAVLLEIASLLLVPCLLGVCLKRPLAAVQPWLKRWANVLSSAVVLFIVFAAFSNSVSSGTWQANSPWISAIAFVLALGVFVAATGLTWLAARALELPREDAITALFCAPQKTLASGAPLAKLIFPGQDLGLLLLPLLFYHPLQLLVGSVLVALLERSPKRSQG